MFIKPFHLISIFCLLGGCRGCGSAPDLLDIRPGAGVARQIVLVKGSELAGADVIWNAGSAGEQAADRALHTARYFQIPAGAALGPHPVCLRNARGDLSNHLNFNVQALSGSWPPPRIEDVAVHSFREKTGHSADVLLFIAAANADAQAEVRVDGLLRPAVLYSAIATDYFNTRPAATYAYPVYHYAGLLVRLHDQPLGRTLKIILRNTDGLEDSAVYTLPAAASDLDSDNDGLLDSWETDGYPAPDGRKIDLAAMGCRPGRKDILVETDWTADAAPLPAIWADLVGVFGQAPVLNPDGSAGISLHIDHGQGGLFNQGGEILSAHAVMDFGPAATVGYVDFYKYKAAHFDPGRLEIFHYGIFGRARPNGASGRGEIWGNDFMVTFATFSTWNSRAAQLGVFMHELGHNLGLRHGGIDNGAADANETFKPNQASSMNYRYQFDGLSQDGDLYPDSPAAQGYSRGLLLPIDEQSINERAGIRDGIPLDFNGNGRFENPTSANTNPGDPERDRTDVHVDYNEWSHLRLNFRAAGSRWLKN